MDDPEDHYAERMEAMRPFLTYAHVLSWFGLARASRKMTYEDVIHAIQALRNWPQQYNVEARYLWASRLSEADLISLEVAPELHAPNQFLYYALKRIFSLELTPQERLDVYRSIQRRRESVEEESTRLYALACEVTNG